MLSTGAVRCWGRGADGELGYGHTAWIGDDEPPASAGPVYVGGTVRQIANDWDHTCALLYTGGIRCWGVNSHGQLGYGHRDNIGDDEHPASVGDATVF